MPQLTWYCCCLFLYMCGHTAGLYLRCAYVCVCSQIPCPRTRSTATIHLELTDSTGLTLSDEFTLSFHMHFHKLLKWLIAGPLALMVAGLYAAMKSLDSEEEEEAHMALPTTTHQH